MPNLIEKIKKMMSPPSAEILAQFELEEARRQFLVYKAAEEQARYMSQYYIEKINRLDKYVKGESTL